MRHPTSSKFNLTSAYALAICMLLLAPFSANAALTISSTRIIQPSDRQSTSIVVANPSNRAYAAQAWINTEADDSTTAVPLIASPALFRIDGVEIQLLRGDTSNPMPLQAEVRMKPVEIGITRLDFYARYYQSSPIVKPGSAEGALSFTVSYK